MYKFRCMTVCFTHFVTPHCCTCSMYFLFDILAMICICLSGTMKLYLVHIHVLISLHNDMSYHFNSIWLYMNWAWKSKNFTKHFHTTRKPCSSCFFFFSSDTILSWFALCDATASASSFSFAFNSISRACNLLPPSWKRFTDRYNMVKHHNTELPELTEQLNFNFGKHPHSMFAHDKH